MRVVLKPAGLVALLLALGGLAGLTLWQAGRMMARPMTSFLISGETKMFEYDVEQVFKTAQEAREYSAKNGVKDISF